MSTPPVPARFSAIAAALLLAAFTLPAAALPPAPEGYRWEKQEAFSDEFNGDELDNFKWRTYHPFWHTGRAPGRFTADTISVKDGKLQIKNRMLDTPRDGFTIACGSVTSISEDAHYGYYEVSMKASSVNLSSTFWFTNRPDHGVHHEIDVVEAVGGTPRFPDFRHRMKSNTHTFAKGRGQFSEGGNTKLKAPADEQFQRYGMWWKDANTIDMYYEGEYAFTIHPKTNLSDTPFDRPMFMCLVTETYDWQPPPTPEDLADDSRNTTYYDWVRAYRLVLIEE
ncbi:MAG: family 16 glycosylhydrolase [Planctomycetota bacterium]